MAEKIIEIAPSDKANKFPRNNSIVFQTTNRVKAPNSAGKNFTRKALFPNC